MRSYPVPEFALPAGLFESRRRGGCSRYAGGGERNLCLAWSKKQLNLNCAINLSEERHYSTSRGRCAVRCEDSVSIALVIVDPVLFANPSGFVRVISWIILIKKPETKIASRIVPY